MNFFSILKLKFSNNIIISILPALITIIKVIDNFNSFIKTVVANEVLISIINDISISIIILYCAYIIRITSKEFELKKNAGFSSTDIYSKNEIKFAIGIKYTSYSLLLIPAMLLFEQYNSFKSREISKIILCEKNSKKIGLLIANFSQSNEDDTFSSVLYDNLRSDLLNIDSINLNKINKYIIENNDRDLDTVKSIFLSNCSKSGMMVYGSRKRRDEKLLNCKIYSHDFLNFNSRIFYKFKNKSPVIIKDSTIIYIQNPRQLDFSIDKETKVLSSFIKALLSYHAGNFDNAIKSMLDALKANTNPENIRFISYCHLFIGNSLASDGNINEAAKHYQSGIEIDSSNAFLYHNLAEINKLNKHILIAYQQYTIANRLNCRLNNPLKELKLVDKSKLHLKLLRKLRLSKINKPDSNLVLNKKPVLEEWNEHCYTIYENSRYGVINDRGDTIVSCKYDEIESMPYKNSDCFIIKSGKRYGAIIHKHINKGYWIHPIALEYSFTSIKAAVMECVDHINLN